MKQLGRRFVMVGILMAGAAGAWAQADKGKSVFEAKCAMCHGKDGAKKLDAVRDRSVEQLAKDIKEGVKGKGGTMPAYGGKLSDAEIQSVAEYTKSLKK